MNGGSQNGFLMREKLMPDPCVLLCVQFEPSCIVQFRESCEFRKVMVESIKRNCQECLIYSNCTSICKVTKDGYDALKYLYVKI